MDAYGYVNGKAVYSRDEFVFASRGFGRIESDSKLLQYAEKVTSGWYDAGWNRTFTTFYLSDYCYARPYCCLTMAEFKRLKEMQKDECDRQRAADEAREWKQVAEYGYADNSVEVVMRDRDGNEKTVMTVYPHGD